MLVMLLRTPLDVASAPRDDVISCPEHLFVLVTFRPPIISDVVGNLMQLDVKGLASLADN
jgi:hypothetical protein